VVDERLAGDADDPDRDLAQGRLGQPGGLDRLEDPRPEAAGDDALLERDDEARRRRARG
jgi:hypothetical protein